MRINIYYGGRGLIEDSTIYVMNKITEVLEEIRVDVKRYNLYECKNEIAALTNTLKEVDGVILAVSLEWFGIGGYMQEFLDACWLYADKSKINKIYMLPIVISQTYGEKDTVMTLSKAWELLGGMVCEGISAYVESQVDFETNNAYSAIIEKKAEDFYRVIKQKPRQMPSSNLAIKQNIKPMAIELTPQESEQLSKYVSNDNYVKKQKEDIEELSQLFKGMLEKGESKETGLEFIKNFKDNFRPLNEEFANIFVIKLSDTQKTLVIDVDNDKLKCYYGENEQGNVSATTTREVLNKIVSGRGTFQGSFMAGEITVKGNFKTFSALDKLFRFQILS